MKRIVIDNDDKAAIAAFLQQIARLEERLEKAEATLRVYADLDYERWEGSPREYHSMYDTVSEPSDAEKESGAAARAYFEES